MVERWNSVKNLNIFANPAFQYSNVLLLLSSYQALPFLSQIFSNFKSSTMTLKQL